MWEFERAARAEGHARIAGVDEAGRGPLAGPVVAACVRLPDPLPEALQGLTDSKRLSARARAAFFTAIRQHALGWGIGIVSAQVIDEINILQATFRAMREAIAACDGPDYVIVDGKLRVPGLTIVQRAVVQGDGRSWSVAAASVLAKETRDALMQEAHERWPEYGFARHKGYGTKEHLAAIARHGPCPLHRLSFQPVAKRMAEETPQRV
ncbi:MAG: ribonuclease HII [Candidatus Sericytochromatia bacterium]|nr:ribonuclease HII [Candidatus Sericytochromatia bacterium]